ncbi:spore protein [Alkalihalobacillus sp. TS-13]|nr:spore protein [Alkalihalobacillus sp. TS-13]
MSKRRGTSKEEKVAGQPNKKTGYGDKKLEGPNRPST